MCSWGAVRVCLSSHVFVLGREVPGAVGDLRAAVLTDVSSDGDLGDAFLPAVGVGRLEEGEHTLGWWRMRRRRRRRDRRTTYEYIAMIIL